MRLTLSRDFLDCPDSGRAGFIFNFYLNNTNARYHSYLATINHKNYDTHYELRYILHPGYKTFSIPTVTIAHNLQRCINRIHIASAEYFDATRADGRSVFVFSNLIPLVYLNNLNKLLRQSL